MVNRDASFSCGGRGIGGVPGRMMQRGGGDYRYTGP